MFSSGSHGSSNQPAEVFRKDLISAMKLPDSYPLQPEDYMLMTDNWKPEWEKGVQVPVNPNYIPRARVKQIREPEEANFKVPKKLIKGYEDSTEEQEDQTDAPKKEVTCQYDLDEVDAHWLEIINQRRADIGDPPIDELTMEKIIEECDSQCNKNMEHAMQTEEGLGIEYDEDVICDVCRAPDSEEGNEMVFCDHCDICVHQACYGIVKVPEGSWMCRTCALGIQPVCILCGIKGGAMKSTRSGTKWSHVSCALWVPEVSIGCVERMEPITKISQIPASRWALICNICRVRTGACIQCSVKTCKIAYHVTCGFENALEMKTFLDDEADVRFRSYCLKHTKARREMDGIDGKLTTPEKPHGTPKKEMTQEEKANERAIRIQNVTEEFYRYTKVKEVAASLNMKEDMDTVDMVYEYWKLKRKSGHNKPLVTPTKEVCSFGSNEEYNLTARMKMFVHLRQDLERVRNLCYMVQRREKLSRQLSVLGQGIFHKQCKMYDAGKGKYTEEDLSWAIEVGKLAPLTSSGNEIDTPVLHEWTDDTQKLEDGDGDTERTDDVEERLKAEESIAESIKVDDVKREEKAEEKVEEVEEEKEENICDEKQEDENEDIAEPDEKQDEEVEEKQDVDKREESDDCENRDDDKRSDDGEDVEDDVDTRQSEEAERTPVRIKREADVSPDIRHVSPPRSRESSVSRGLSASPLSADADESEVADDSDGASSVGVADEKPPPSVDKQEEQEESNVAMETGSRHSSEVFEDVDLNIEMSNKETVQDESVSNEQTPYIMSEESEIGPSGRPSLKRKISLKAIRESQKHKNGMFSQKYKRRKRDSRYHKKSKQKVKSESVDTSELPEYSIIRTPTRESPSKISIKIRSPRTISPKQLQMQEEAAKIRERVLSTGSSPRGSLKSYRIPKKKPAPSNNTPNGPQNTKDTSQIDPFEFVDELEEPVRKPETRSRRKLIEDELDSESSCSERQFENVDGEISMCLPGHETTFLPGEENLTPARYDSKEEVREEKIGKKRNIRTRFRDAAFRFLNQAINL